MGDGREKPPETIRRLVCRMKKCRMMNVLQNMRHHRLPHQLMKDRFDSAAAIQSLIRIRASQCYDSRQTVSAQVSPPLL